MFSQQEAEETARFLYRTQFRYYIPQAFKAVEPETPYEKAWYHDYMAYMLQRTLPLTKNIDGLLLNPTPTKRIRRLVINIPPRHLKSRYVNGFKSFILGNYPWEKIMSSSYSAKLSLRHNVETRKMMEDEYFKLNFPRTIIEKDTEDLVTTTEGGECKATSTGGTSIGLGGNFLMADDPLNPLEALSDLQRENCNDWYKHSFFTRGNNPKTSVIILIMQRLHEKDVTGMCLEMNQFLPEELQWHWVCLPVKSEETKKYFFYDSSYSWPENEPLHPDRYGDTQIKSWLTELGSYNFAGQFLQKPAPTDGGLVRIKWINKYRHWEKPKAEDVLYKVHSWDTASKIGTNNDKSALITATVTKAGKIYIEKTKSEKLEFPDLKRKIIQYYENELPNVVLIEDKSSGIALIQDLKAETNMPIVPVTPTKDKVTRLVQETPTIEAGNLFHPADVDNEDIAEFELELIRFPNATYKDRVDAFSQLLQYVRTRGRRNIRISSFTETGLKVSEPIRDRVTEIPYVTQQAQPKIISPDTSNQDEVFGSGII